jgi:hypothetical protein
MALYRDDIRQNDLGKTKLFLFTIIYKRVKITFSNCALGQP